VDARTRTIQEQFQRLFERYGLPGTIRSDNGRPFAVSSAPLGLSQLSAWWVALGIDLDRTDPGCPQQNGAHERMHRDIACELERKIDGDLAAQAAAAEVWRQIYNQQRPHEALGMRTPAEVYRPSERPYNGTPDHLEYPAEYLDRQVGNRGHIKIENRMIFVTSALAGWNVGLKRSGQDTYALYFARLCLGTLDLPREAFIVCRPQEQEKEQ
jgi:hypothetical protein